MPADTAFVLVRPEFLGNIGAVARVMKNFGLTQLRFVSPPRNYKDAEARKMAVDAFDLLKSAEVFPTLADALKDVEVAIATTSAKQRQVDSVSSRCLSRIIGQNVRKVAIVFGNERDGLTNDELLRCHHITSIPSAPDFHSLNLAQAAAIYAYELSTMNNVDLSQDSCSDRLTIGSDVDELIEQVASLLEKAEFTRKYNKHQLLVQLRAFYQRAHPTSREHDILKAAIYKLNHKITPID